MESISTEQIEISKEKPLYLDCKKQIINEIKFNACIKRPGVFTIRDSNGKVIYNHSSSPAGFEFSDFNEDGFPDVLLDYITNVPGIKELLIFNPEKNNFSKIEDFENFPSAIKIKGTHYYYSYHRSGCADSNWDSDLFEIIENKAIRHGNIRGIGCGVDEMNGIYINKINNKVINQIKFIKREEGYWDGKWEFIEEYWNKNYEKFIQNIK